MAKLIISTSPVSTLPTPSDLINDLCATQIIHYPEVAKFSRCSIRRLNQECVLSLHRAGGFSHITPGQFTTSAQREVTIFNPLSKEIIATTRAFPY